MVATETVLLCIWPDFSGLTRFVAAGWRQLGYSLALRLIRAIDRFGRRKPEPSPEEALEALKRLRLELEGLKLQADAWHESVNRIKSDLAKLQN